MLNISQLQKAMFSLYQGTSENAFLRIKLAHAERYQNEVAQIRARFDGSSSAPLEKKMEALAERKTALAQQVRNVERALDRMIDVRTQLVAMNSAIGTGSAEAFDAAYEVMDNYAGVSSIVDPSSFGGRSIRQAEVVSAGSYDIAVSRHYLASDYAITLTDGTELTPNQGTKVLSGGDKSFQFSDLSVVSVSGDDVTIHDAATGQDYTGTLRRRGAGVMNSWFYNGFAGDGLTRAKEDISNASTYLTRSENDWRGDVEQLNGAVKQTASQFTNTQKDYQKTAFDEIDEKNAEIKAAKTRYEMTMGMMAFTSSAGRDMIQNMFMTPSAYEKKSMFDIMSGQ